MAVTELALVRVLPPNTITTPSLLQHLRLARDAMKKASGHPFYFLSCLKDASLIIFLGGWPSVKLHMEEWIPSQENQELLDMMEDEIEVEYMFHLDLEPEEREGLLGSQVVSVERYSVKKGEGGRKQLEEGLMEMKEKVDGTIVSGWRIDWGYVNSEGAEDEKERDEYVVLTGWKGRETSQEHVVAGSSGHSLKVSEYVDVVDIKKGVWLNSQT